MSCAEFSLRHGRFVALPISIPVGQRRTPFDDDGNNHEFAAGRCALRIAWAHEYNSRCGDGAGAGAGAGVFASSATRGRVVGTKINDGPLFGCECRGDDGSVLGGSYVAAAAASASAASVCPCRLLGGSIPRGEGGEPVLPAFPIQHAAAAGDDATSTTTWQHSASITHKAGVAAALVNLSKNSSTSKPPPTVGVDIEVVGGARSGERLARRVLTSAEAEAVASRRSPLVASSSDATVIVGSSTESVLPQEEMIRRELTRADEVLLRFSLKEALYKAIFPHVRRRVAFKEVEVSPLSGGRAEVLLEDGLREAMTPGDGDRHSIELCWYVWNDFFLTSACVNVDSKQRQGGVL